MKIMKKVVSFMLLLSLILPLSIGIELKAAEKPSLSNEEMIIGIGSYGDNGGGYYSKDDKYCLYVENSEKKATYTFTSSDKKIVTVKKDKSGTKAYITGVKAGKSTITVKQKLKGKTTTIGKCKVTVKNAKLVVDKEELATFSLGDYYVGRYGVRIENFNPEAKYTFSSNKKGIKFSDESYEVVDYIEGMFYQDIKCNATKTGTYKITVKETYKKKTRKLGTFSVTVLAPSSEKTKEICVGQVASVGNLLSNANYLKYWVSNDGYEDIVELMTDEEDIYVKGLKTGKAVLNYYYDNNGKKGKKFSSTTITVKKVEVLDIDLEPTLTVTLDDYYDSSIYYDIKTSPEEGIDYMDDIKSTVTSSDKSVIDITYVENGYFGYEIKKAGTAVITVTVGDISKTMKVTVEAE